jgi:hypothetical protein
MTKDERHYHATPLEPGDRARLTTTLNRLRSAEACTERYRHLVTSLGGVSFDHNRPINLITILDINGAEDCIWALRATVEPCERQARLISADCAEMALPLYERDYPADQRPRTAIGVARQYARGQGAAAASAAARAAAWNAARAVASAVASAAAWSAAWSAAWDVASDAAWAAAWEAASAIASAAAWDVARAAAWDAARAVASDVAWNAAKAAAWDAARDAARAAQADIIRRYLMTDEEAEL